MDKLPEQNLNNEEHAREEAKRQALENFKNSKITIVDIEELAEAEARKAADAYMTESKQTAKGVVGFFKKMWKHTYVDEFYRQRQVNRTRKQIKETGNIYAGRNIDAEAGEEAKQSVVKRFASDYEGLLSEGEDTFDLNETDKEKVESIKQLVRDYAVDKTMDEEAFKAEKDRILKTLNKEDKNKKSVDAYADNLFEIATNARVAIEHGAKMEELDFGTNMIIGKAKSSLKTEAKFSAVDKLTDKMKKSWIGKFVSPAMLSTAVGIGYSVSVGIGAKFMRSKVAAYATLGGAVVFSGAVAGMNESQRIARERQQHGLERAEGGEFNPGDKRREKMEQYQYAMAKSTDFENFLKSAMFEKDQDGNEKVKDIKEEDLAAILTTLSEIDARKSLNQEKNIDLISYSNAGSVEKESTDLGILVAQTKAEILKQYKDGKFKNVFQEGGRTLEDVVDEQTEAIKGHLLGGEKGIDAKDKAFKTFKRNSIAKKVAWTVGIGLVAGGLAQEAHGMFSDHTQSVIEGMKGSENANLNIQTPLEHLRGWISGDASHMGLGNAVEHHVGNANFKLPEGVDILKNSDGTFNLMRGGTSIGDHLPLHFGANGALDQASMNALGEHGIVSSVDHHMIDVNKQVNIPAKDWIAQHPGQTTEIHRDLWYGNDTPMYTDPETGKLLGADLNELAGRFGGVNGSGISENGDFVFSAAHLKPDGSFVTVDGKTLSVDAQEQIKNGTLKCVLSFTKGTQNHVIEATYDKFGNAVFDHNNPLVKELFSVEKGHAVFKGAYAEIAQTVGVKDGVEHVRILGTIGGDNSLTTIKDTIVTHQDIATNVLRPSLDTEPPYYIPFFYRKPLEPVKYGEKAPVGEPVPAPVAKKEEKEEEKDFNPMAFEGFAATVDEKENETPDAKNISRTNNKSIDNDVDYVYTEDDVKKRAYEIYENRQKTGKDGNADADYFEAKKQLEQEKKDNKERKDREKKLAKLKKDLIEAVRQDEQGEIERVRAKIKKLQEK